MNVVIYLVKRESDTYVHGAIKISRSDSSKYSKDRTWSASRSDPAKPWIIRLDPNFPLWITEAKSLIGVILSTLNLVGISIQLPEKLTGREPIVEGYHGFSQLGGDSADSHWKATRRGRGWSIEFSKNPPPQLEPGIKQLIKAALKAAQVN